MSMVCHMNDWDIVDGHGKNSKRDFYLDVYTILNRINYMDHMGILIMNPVSKTIY